MLSRKESKLLVDNAQHRPDHGGKDNTPARFLQNLLKLLLSGRCSEELQVVKQGGFLFMSKPQITGAREQLVPQSSQAGLGRTGSETRVYKPQEFFVCLCLCLFCFCLTAWTCLSIIIISVKGINNPMGKVRNGSSGSEPTGGSREQRRASLALVAQAPEEPLESSTPLERESSWTHNVETLIHTVVWSKGTTRKAGRRGTFFVVQVEKSLFLDVKLL